MLLWRNEWRILCRSFVVVAAIAIIASGALSDYYTFILVHLFDSVPFFPIQMEPERFSFELILSERHHLNDTQQRKVVENGM